MNFKMNGRSVTYGEAYDMLEQLKNQVFGTKECPYRCKFVHSGDMKDGNGDKVYLDPMEGDVRVISAGAADGGYCKISHVVVCVPDEFFDESLKDCPVDAYKFIGTAVAIFHERRHVEQHLIARKGGSAFANVMYLAHMTNLGNPVYTSYNYYTDPTEVDAQHMALRNVYQYLSGLVGPDAANEYVCFYQERQHAIVEELKADGKKLVAEGKITAEHYKSKAYMLRDFIDPPDSGKYGDVQEIFDRYVSAFADSVHARRLYPEHVMKGSPDSIAEYFRDHRAVYRRFRNETDGYEALKMGVNIHFESDGDCYERGLFKTNPKKHARLKSTKAYLIKNAKENRGLDLSDAATIAKPLVKRLLPSMFQSDIEHDVADLAVREVDEQVHRKGLLTKDELAKMSQKDTEHGGLGDD